MFYKDAAPMALKWVLTPALILAFSPWEKEKRGAISGGRTTVRPGPPLGFPKTRRMFLPLLEERAGVRTGNNRVAVRRGG